jgi:hypothetical protein
MSLSSSPPDSETSSVARRKLRIIMGGDDAGFEYKEAIKSALAADQRVEAVEDVGPHSTQDKTAYPVYAVEAAKKIASGEADRGKFHTHIPQSVLSVMVLDVG